MKRLILFLPLLLLIGCDDDDGKKKRRPKPSSLIFEKLTVEEISPSVDDDVESMLLHTAPYGDQLISYSNENVRESKSYVEFERLLGLKVDTTYNIALGDAEGNDLAYTQFNPWQRIKDTEYREDGEHQLTINTDDMRILIDIVVIH